MNDKQTRTRFETLLLTAYERCLQKRAFTVAPIPGAALLTIRI
jgi:hypothetical protein